MRIKKIQLKDGYKRFYDLTIDLGEDPKRIIALVGPNGCGKSSVLDGFLYLNNVHNLLGNKSAKNHEYHSMNKNPGFTYQSILVDFVEGSYQEVRNQRAPDASSTTMFSFRSPYRYNNNLKIDQSRATAEIRLNNYGASTSTDLDDKMEDNYRRLYIKYNKYLNDTDCTPSQAKLKIIGDLNSSIEKCLQLKLSSLGSIEASQGTLYFKKIDHPIEFEFNVLSSGEKEVIDILLDLYLRKDEYNNTIFLLDEPELHINTAIQKKLLIEINKLIGPNCQIWVTTHSIGFLRALQDELKDECEIIEFKEDMNLASTTTILTPMKKTMKNWREIFKVAIDDLAYLVSPKQIIYCEGRDEPGANGNERGFDAKVFNNIFSEKYHDTLFVSSGGNTELDQRSNIALAILSKVFPSIEIYVFKDRDMSSGRQNTESDRLAYLSLNPTNHRVMKRWEIENYLFDKSVLIKFCLANNFSFNETEYDAYVTDIINQNIKDESSRFRNFCNITHNINPEIFKLALSEQITEDMAVYIELENCIFNRQ